MRVRFGIILFGCLLSSVFQPSSSAQVLWYNGDFDGAFALVNNRTTNNPDDRVYDDFVVPSGEIWHITGLFSHNTANFLPDGFDWEIREGVSEKTGGTIVAGQNDVTGTAALTGRDFFGDKEYRHEVAANLVLTPGTYWLMLRPVKNGAGEAAITSTSGLNAVGSPPGNDGNSFRVTAVYNFIPAINFTNGADDFSMGILGRVEGASTPEPGACTILIGLVAATAMAARRSRRT